MAISLASIKKNMVDKPPIMLVHGQPGAGKTTFAAGAPNSVFLNAEDGMGILDVECFPLATNYNDLVDAIQALLSEEHQFKWLVVDSLSAIEPLILDHVETTYTKADKAYGRNKALVYNTWRNLFGGLKMLRSTKGMGILLIAHTEVTKFDPPDGDAYSRYSISLTGDVHELLREECDIIAFAQEKVLTPGDEDKKTGTRKATTTGERVLHLAGSPAFVAKNRFWLPEVIPLDWGAFQSALAASLNKQS